MVREAISRSGFRFERSFTAFGVANFIGILTILWGAASAYQDLRAADKAAEVKLVTIEKTLGDRLAVIEARRPRLEVDHDAILEMRGDIKTILARIDKRGSLELFRIDPRSGAPSILAPTSSPPPAPDPNARRLGAAGFGVRDP